MINSIDISFEYFNPEGTESWHPSASVVGMSLTAVENAFTQITNKIKQMDKNEAFSSFGVRFDSFNFYLQGTYYFESTSTSTQRFMYLVLYYKNIAVKTIKLNLINVPANISIQYILPSGDRLLSFANYPPPPFTLVSSSFYWVRQSMDIDWVQLYDDVGVEYDNVPSSWYKAHLLDQKQNTIIQGKYLEFTNKSDSTDISKVAIVGGGILASGFKGATSTVDSFRVLTNLKLKPGTYREALNSALGIKDSMGTYNMFANVNGYKYVGMFKVIPDATKVEELKTVGDAATGTIASAGGYVLATGKKALMEALGFLFNSQAGLWMMRTSAFMTLSTSTGEIAVNGTEGQILYERTSTTDVTGMNDPALEKQSDYWDAVNDYYNDQKQDEVDNGTTTEDDETPEEETEMSELEENQLTNEKLKTALLQTANDYLSQVKGMLDFNYDNIPKKQDILDQGHEEATTEVEGKKQAQRNLTAWTDWHSQTNGAHTDVQGNELSHKSGLAGLLAGVLPGVLNEYFTRVTGKNMADEWNLQDVQERVEQVLGTFISLFNIKEEDLPSLDSEGLSDFDKEMIQLYNSFKDKKNLTEDVTADEGVV